MPVHEIKLNPEQVAIYRAGYLDFLSYCELEELLEQERQWLHQRSIALLKKALTLKGRTEKLLDGLKGFGLILWLCCAIVEAAHNRWQV